MKIAFDLRRINNPGIGRYMKCLVEAILAQDADHEYLMILPPDGPGLKGDDSGRVERIAPRLPYYSLAEQIEMPRILRRRGVDLLHSPHFNLPLRPPCPTVVTIHDVIYLACPGDLPSSIGRLYYSGMMKAATRLANRVLTDSEFSRHEIIHYLRCDPDKIEVIYPAVPPEFLRPVDAARVPALLRRLRIDEEYILYTGIYKPRKNHAGLLRAFHSFLKNGGRCKLLIAGPLAEGEAALRDLARSLGILDYLCFAGYVPDDQLAALYTGARVYACPSLYEGFGFTILEAMACGVPVVCTGETSLPEVAGSAALFADSRRPEEFAAALHRAYFDPELRRNLIAGGLANIRRFNWDEAARRALAAYQGAAGVPAEKVVFA